MKRCAGGAEFVLSRSFLFHPRGFLFPDKVLCATVQFLKRIAALHRNAEQRGGGGGKDGDRLLWFCVDSTGGLEFRSYMFFYFLYIKTDVNIHS